MTKQTEQGAAILPCPLCGGEAQLVDFAGYEVICHCGLNFCDGTDASAEAAARGWNRRAPISSPEGCGSADVQHLIELVLSAAENRADKDWTLMHLDLSEAVELAKGMAATSHPTPKDRP